MSDFWSTTFPSWATGIGTIGLAWVAWRSMRRERAEKKGLEFELSAERNKAIELAREKNEREELAARRAQASQVVAWSDVVNSSAGGLVVTAVSSVTDMQLMGPVAAAFVRNASPLPITDVQVSWGYAGRDQEGRVATGIHGTDVLSGVPPEATRWIMRPDALRQQPPLPLELTFLDAAGIRWKRDRQGGLTELSQ